MGGVEACRRGEEASLFCLQGVFGHIITGDEAFFTGAHQLGLPPLSRSVEDTPHQHPGWEDVTSDL